MTERTPLNLVVIGHVDHGKSTLVGRLLFEKGLVGEEVIRRNEHMGQETGKASFKYAWVMDRSEESRRRGITIDLAFADIETRRREVHIIDAPGHSDFVRNMITGTSSADAALLVVDASEGVMPQTREHATLARLLGVRQVLIALNKIDRIGYGRESVDNASRDVRNFVESLGFARVECVPVSAWEGENLTRRGPRMAWYGGPTLEEAMDSFAPRASPAGGPLRVPVMDVLHVEGVGTVAVGRVESGSLSKGETVSVAPGGPDAEVRSIRLGGKELKTAVVGQSVGVALKGVARNEVHRGDVLGPAGHPPLPAKELTVRVAVTGVAGVVRRGWTPYLHAHTAAVPVRLVEIIERLDPATGMKSEGTLEALVNGDAAVVRLEPVKPLVIEVASELPPLGRFALREGRVTVGAGSCIAVVPDRSVGGEEVSGAAFSYKHRKSGTAAAKLREARTEREMDIWGRRPGYYEMREKEKKRRREEG